MEPLFVQLRASHQYASMDGRSTGPEELFLHRLEEVNKSVKVNLFYTV